ncbi:unnamed protein product, partial [marine sediment metagenome]
MKKIKERKLPLSRQLFYISKFLTNRGIEPHGSELEDLLDSTLHYDENKSIVCDYYGISEDTPTEADYMKDQLEHVEGERTEKAKMQDYHRRHKKTVTVLQLLKNPKLAEKWMKNPGSMDIKGIDIKEGLPAPRKKKSSFSKTTKNPSPVAEMSRKNYTKRLNPGDIKERTIGILGQKGTGKTYYTRELIERMGDGCVCFDTIGVLKPSNCKRYEVVQQNIEQQ